MMNLKQLKPLVTALLLTLSQATLFSQQEKLLYKGVFAPSESLVSKEEKEFRKEICLNGKWDFQAVPVPDTYEPGKGLAPELSFPRADAWDKVKIKIPSPWNINDFATYNQMEGPDHRNYPSYPKAWENVQMAWMKRTVVIPSDWENQLIKIYFEAVAGHTQVYVKDKKVAENFDIFLPFEADISDLVRPGETIEILVGVRKSSLFDDRATVGRRIIPAGSMWGSFIAGIWQDVYLLAIPKVSIKDIFVKPLVSKGLLELDVTVANRSSGKAALTLSGEIREWINLAGSDIHTAPIPNWELSKHVTLALNERKIRLNANETQTVIIQIPVGTALKYWTPERPNLYGLLLHLSGKKKTDTKYERFGWREWTIQESKHCLNGQPYELRGDSWHFMGVPQMTRRYAWAWYSAIKAANGNAVRPHAQVYPRFYLDVADEMGVCVLAETANWASDGGPKLDSPVFWENSKNHLKRMVLRDRNHASVFGWSISNENRPVILHVFNKPELMPFQQQAWKDWLEIASTNDPTRPWVSSDGEDDGEGILPVTVGHYGDRGSMERWISIGKPWGIGEHSMAYYGTPKQVSKYNGERAYESQEARMEGLANECYHLIADQRKMGASYVSVFNLAWYGLKPLPFGKKDLTTPPSIQTDGVFFPHYTEGMPGIQPERMGPYCSTLNPGYDPGLPLYEPWPMFDAIRAANAPDAPAWTKWAEETKEKVIANTSFFQKKYTEVLFVGKSDSKVKQIFSEQGVEFVEKIKSPNTAIIIIDGEQAISDSSLKELKQLIEKGSDSWVWGITPSSLPSFNTLLPLPLNLEKREASSFLPVSRSWMRGMNNSDFYFCEIQDSQASDYGMSGDFVSEGNILLNACNTDWRRWNRRPEEVKTASTIRSESEKHGANPVFVKYRHGNTSYVVSTLIRFANSDKGGKTLARILENAGIPFDASKALVGEISLDANGYLSKALKDFWIWSPRPLDDLLIEPDMPKLSIHILPSDKSDIRLNGQLLAKWTELPLKQGWNHFAIETENNHAIQFQCQNKGDFLAQLKASIYVPEKK